MLPRITTTEGLGGAPVGDLTVMPQGGESELALQAVTSPPSPPMPPGSEKQVAIGNDEPQAGAALDIRPGTPIAMGRDGTPILHGPGGQGDTFVGYYSTVNGEVTPVDAMFSSRAEHPVPGPLGAAYIALHGVKYPPKLANAILRKFGDKAGISVLMENHAPPKVLANALAALAMSDNRRLAKRAARYRERVLAFGEQIVDNVI